MSIKTIIGIVSVAILFLFVWQHYKQREKSDVTESEQYDQITATINQVYPSGRNYKRSTLINVSYTYANQQRRANLRREGYKEGTYNKGDTIVIYVNPSNPDEIK